MGKMADCFGWLRKFPMSQPDKAESELSDSAEMPPARVLSAPAKMLFEGAKDLSMAAGLDEVSPFHLALAAAVHPSLTRFMVVQSSWLNSENLKQQDKRGVLGSVFRVFGCVESGRPDSETQAVLNCAGREAASEGRDEILDSDIVLALFTERTSFLARLLQASTENPDIDSACYLAAGWRVSVLRRLQTSSSHLNACKGLIDAPVKHLKRPVAAFSVESTSVESTSDEPAKKASGFLQVMTAFGDATADSKRMKQYKRLLAPIPLDDAPDPDDVYLALAARFPWMEEVNVLMAGACAAVRKGVAVRLPPLMLVGPPGCGKTDWAISFAEKGGYASRVLSMAAGADGSFVSGTERTYSQSQPSLPARLMCDLGRANPFLVLDEIDKAATARSSGSVVDALLPLLEERTSRRFQDIHLQGDLNAAYIGWVFTANSADSLSRPFLERVNLLRVSRPSLAQVEGVARAMVVDLPAIALEGIRGGGDSLHTQMMRAYADGGTLRAMRDARDKAVRAGLWSPPIASSMVIPLIAPALVTAVEPRLRLVESDDVPFG